MRRLIVSGHLCAEALGQGAQEDRRAVILGVTGAPSCGRCSWATAECEPLRGQEGSAGPGQGSGQCSGLFLLDF